MRGVSARYPNPVSMAIALAYPEPPLGGNLMRGSPVTRRVSAKYGCRFNLVAASRERSLGYSRLICPGSCQSGCGAVSASLGSDDSGARERFPSPLRAVRALTRDGIFLAEFSVCIHADSARALSVVARSRLSPGNNWRQFPFLLLVLRRLPPRAARCSRSELSRWRNAQPGEGRNQPEIRARHLCRARPQPAALLQICWFHQPECGCRVGEQSCAYFWYDTAPDRDLVLHLPGHVLSDRRLPPRRAGGAASDDLRCLPHFLSSSGRWANRALSRRRR